MGSGRRGGHNPQYNESKRYKENHEDYSRYLYD
jgi:hypothetical protein